ncbi:MAG: two-component system response regulator [Deltaproteobacteria bacterium CG11_big_fil_rev_8_21_14_0_20_49_13]|nr:MAG: two-component system response regulator [Deltaproteobacteria bacterium CG11_big_fil_rev_8_21_14_0_20_49_13]
MVDIYFKESYNEAMKKILIIDDAPDVIRLLNARLTKEGYEVLQASHGEEGLVVARESKPGLILLDVLMPGTDGFDVCERLRSDPETKDIPVVFLTSLEQIECVKRGMTCGAKGYIVKPFDEKELLKVIGENIS